jgi:hypothetical protein
MELGGLSPNRASKSWMVVASGFWNKSWVMDVDLRQSPKGSQLCRPFLAH